MGTSQKSVDSIFGNARQIFLVIFNPAGNGLRRLTVQQILFNEFFQVIVPHNFLATVAGVVPTDVGFKLRFMRVVYSLYTVAIYFIGNVRDAFPYSAPNVS